MWFRKKIPTKLDAKHKQDSITKRMEKSTKAKELKARHQYSAESVPQEIPSYLVDCPTQLTLIFMI